MNIGEAGDVATVLQAIVRGRRGSGTPIEADELAAAMLRLDERAGKALQLAGIVRDPAAVEMAARLIAHRWERST